jgi:hypothetical protein
MKAALITLVLSVLGTAGALAFLGKVPGVPGLGGAAADSTAAIAAPPPSAEEVSELRGQLAQMRTDLAAAEARADSLRILVEGRREDEVTLEAEAQAEAADLAATLTKLDEEALSGVVQRLDGRSFVRLYDAASARNRLRLLDALTPAQAAAFVRHRLPGGGAPAHTAASRDTTDAPTATDR